MKTVLKMVATSLLVLSSLWGTELVLLDTSGSMYGERGDKAKKMVQKLLDKNIRVLGYNKKLTEIKSVSDIEYNYGSDLGKALEYVYLSERDVTYLNIITDGDVGDRLKTLRFGTFLKNHGVSICSVSVDADIPAQLKQISKKALSTTDILKARKMCQGVRKKALNEVVQDIDENQYNLF